MVEADNECNLPCSRKMWDGYGRWNVNDQWKPFMEEINLPSSQSKTVIGKVFCEHQNSRVGDIRNLHQG